jgi:hypothetical protein
VRSPGHERREDGVQANARRQLAVDVRSGLVQSAPRETREPDGQPALRLRATDVDLDAFHAQSSIDPHGPVAVDGDIGHLLIGEQRFQRTGAEQLRAKSLVH